MNTTNTTPSGLPPLPPLLAELRAAFEKRQTTPTSQCVGLPLTRKQMLDWDENSLLAGQWRLT